MPCVKVLSVCLLSGLYIIPFGHSGLSDTQLLPDRDKVRGMGCFVLLIMEIDEKNHLAYTHMLYPPTSMLKHEYRYLDFYNYMLANLR